MHYQLAHSHPIQWFTKRFKIDSIMQPSIRVYWLKRGWTLHSIINANSNMHVQYVTLQKHLCTGSRILVENFRWLSVE